MISSWWMSLVRKKRFFAEFILEQSEGLRMTEGGRQRTEVGECPIPAQELIETMQILLLCSDAAYVKRVRALRISTFPAID